MSAPTAFTELNDILAELVAGAQSALDENFVGAYLLGSFAVGDADAHSDVDFIIVMNTALTASEQSALRNLHQRLHERPVHWAQHLEGSYAPKDELRVIGPEKWFFFDNGSIHPEWDAHCNTYLVRWTIRERGIVLSGPEARELVAPVSADALRAEARVRVSDYGVWACEPQERFASGMSRWKQPYLVLTLCRTLHTIATGAVVSKQEAGEWALRTLDERWADLIALALSDRPEPWQRVHEEADAAIVARTIAFADYALAEAAAR